MGMMINRRRVCGGEGEPLPEGVVDLGLPSGTLWAKGNIVKDEQGNYSLGNETDYGCYFSWGNIDGHNNGEGYSFSAINYNASPGSTLTGNISPIDAEHDAAVARLGNGWRLPTSDDFVELFNSAYTTNVWTTQNGVKGILVTSNINGNSIFFPASGSFSNKALYYLGKKGFYQSSTLDNESNANTYYLFFETSGMNPTASISRMYGLSVRAVYKPDK